MKTFYASFLFFIASTLLANAQIPPYVPANGLVGWWPFSGNANDASGNGNNGTDNGATLTTDRFGNTNAAYSFNGYSNYISVPHSTSLNLSGDMSFSVWLKTSAAIQNATMLEKYSANPTANSMAGFSATLANGNGNIGRWDVGNGNFNEYQSLGTNDTITNNQWHNLVGTINGNVQSFYLDGILQATHQNQYVVYGMNTDPLLIGNDMYFSSNRYFNGNIDDIGIWNRALTQQEITQLYTGSSNSIPTLSHLALVVLSIIVLGMGIFFVQRVT